MFRVMIPLDDWVLSGKTISIIVDWCNANIGPSKYARYQGDTRYKAWQIRTNVRSNGTPVFSRSKIPKDGVFICVAFERKVDAIWFKVVWV